MSKLNPAQIAAARELIAACSNLAALLTAEPKKGKKAKAAAVVTEVQSLEPTTVTIDIRPNGLLTAISGKTVREALSGTKHDGANVTGNTKAVDAAKLLTDVGIVVAVAGEKAPTTEKAAKTDEHGVTVEQRKALNKKLADDMRAHGVTPSGSAWTAFKKGERGWKSLKAMNVADGIEAPKTATKAPKTETVAVTAGISDEDRAKKVEHLVESGWDRAVAVDVCSKLV